MINDALKERNLPDVLRMPDSKIITTKQDWENIARPYWKDLLLREEYGRLPPLIVPKISTRNNLVDFAGKAKWEEISFSFQINGKQHTIPTQLIYPKDSKESPFFIYINFSRDVPDKYLPVEEIIDNGFGIFTVCYQDITSDNDDFNDGLAGLFSDGKRTVDSAGKLSYWSYFASRMMDYLQTRKEANKNLIGIAGHSRLGKTALLTAALDERFSFVCSNNSGCSGVALSRGCCEGGESIADIYKRFPYWFCPNYAKYVDNEQGLPFDQHCLFALIAPRIVCVGTAIEDIWADNDNQFLSCVAASKVWELYQKRGLISSNSLPICGDVFTEGKIKFHLREGKHFHSRTDWLIYINALKNEVLDD